MADDAFLKALTALEATLADNQERTRLIKKRITQLRRLRAKGASYAEIVATGNGPLLVQLLTESSRALDTSGASVRRAEARALYAEGLRWTRSPSASASRANAFRPSCARPRSDAYVCENPATACAGLAASDRSPSSCAPARCVTHTHRGG
jgi:hypothetical protein